MSATYSIFVLYTMMRVLRFLIAILMVMIIKTVHDLMQQIDLNYSYLEYTPSVHKESIFLFFMSTKGLILLL